MELPESIEIALLFIWINAAGFVLLTFLSIPLLILLALTGTLRLDQQKYQYVAF